MSGAFPSNPPPQGYPGERWRGPPRWIFPLLSALFVLILLSVVLGVLVPVLQGSVPVWSVTPYPWGWVAGLVIVLIAIAILMAVIRIVMWGVWGGIYGRPYLRRTFRHSYRWGPYYGLDPAVEIARERFARGEITRDQFDEILHRLEIDRAGPLR